MEKRQQQAIIYAIVGLAGLFLIVWGVRFMYLERGYKLYENKRAGVKIKYPGTWTVNEKQYGVVVGFVSPKKSAMDLFQENVTIVMQDLSVYQERITLKKYAAKARKQLKIIFRKGIEFTEAEPTFIAGMPAFRLVYEGTNKADPTQVKIMTILCIKDNIGYQINYAAFVQTYDEHLPQAKKMIRSFRLK